MKRKLRSKRGESLLESMAAAMIIALALLILAGSLTAAARINRRTAVWENAPSSEQGVLAAPCRSDAEALGEKTACIAFSSETLSSSESYRIQVYKNSIQNTTRGSDEYGGKVFLYYDLVSSEPGP